MQHASREHDIDIRTTKPRRLFYKENWFVALTACAALFASIGAGWPFVADLWNRHDQSVGAAVRLQTEIDGIDKRVTELENLRDYWRRYYSSNGKAESHTETKASTRDPR